MKIVFASQNKGKIAELQAMLKNQDIQIIPQTEFNVSEAEETASTFVENALLKARHASHATGLPALADDSGLVVPALNGAPGIHSARYAGARAQAKENIEKLLAQLKSVPEEKRNAFFYCVLVYLSHADDPTPLICEGTWHGAILTTSRGENGFGYDPIFYVPNEQCSAAELSAETKNRLSHRGQALQLLIKKLTK